MSDSHALAAEIQLLKRLKAALPLFNNNIVFETDPDYSLVNTMIAKQELPLLALEGPTQERNATFTSHGKPVEKYGTEIPGSGGVKGQFRKFTAEEDVDFKYAATIMAKTKRDLSNAMNAVYAFFMNGKKITVERCPGTPGNGTIDYEIDLIEKFVPGRRVNNSGLKESLGTIIIRGVKISDGEIFSEGYVAADEPIVDTVLK